MPSDRITWEELVLLEPRLIDLERQAQENATWGLHAFYGTAGCPVFLKSTLEGLVGWYRKDNSPSFPAAIEQEDAREQGLDDNWQPLRRSGRFQDVAARRPWSRMSRMLTQEAERASGAGVLWEIAAWSVARWHLFEILDP